MVERVFTTVYGMLFSPKAGIVTKDGMNSTASNLLLVLIAYAREPIENYLRQMYAPALQINPNLLSGILNENCINGYSDRQIRLTYNKSLLRFYKTVQQVAEQSNIFSVCSQETERVDRYGGYPRRGILITRW